MYILKLLTPSKCRNTAYGAKPTRSTNINLNYKVMKYNISKESLLELFTKRLDVRKTYDECLAKISNEFFEQNNIPFKVGDRITFRLEGKSIIGVINYVTIANNINNIEKIEPKVVVSVEGYIGLIEKADISKIKKI